jgi:hypothetical protein
MNVDCWGKQETRRFAARLAAKGCANLFDQGRVEARSERCAAREAGRSGEALGPSLTLRFPIPSRSTAWLFHISRPLTRPIFSLSSSSLTSLSTRWLMVVLRDFWWFSVVLREIELRLAKTLICEAAHAVDRVVCPRKGTNDQVGDAGVFELREFFPTGHGSARDEPKSLAVRSIFAS